MTALICGSMAYDTIMVFEDQFKNHILPDQVHILNVCFFVPNMRREFGGCAGNIAFNLKMLGGNPQILAAVGDDFDSYRYQLQKHGLSDSFIKHIPGEYTAQAFITTDKDNNQITAFHPGAMNFAHKNDFSAAIDGVEIGIVSPDGKQAMHEHAENFSQANIPFIFDPGQGLPMFSGDELNVFIRQAKYVIVNDYESKMLQEKTEMTEEQIASQLDALIVTRGGKGAIIYVDGIAISIPPAPISEAVDPTGCGDAFRGGLLYGLMKGVSWEETGRIASLCGAMKIEHGGTQNHHFTPSEFEERYEKSFGLELKL
ncbi:MAG: carbohydrate kinase family protein [Arenicella sp.]